MTETWLLAALWLGLALVATLLSIWLRIATALSEIVVGTVAQLIIGATLGTALLHTDDSWIKFLSGRGSEFPSGSIVAVELLNSIIELADCRCKRICVVANLGAKCIVHLTHSIGQPFQFVVHHSA